VVFEMWGALAAGAAIAREQLSSAQT
jgi:hypothetical protein